MGPPIALFVSALLLGPAHAARLVGVAEAQAAVASGALVLDARDWTGYLSGHIPGAVRAPWWTGTRGVLGAGPLDATTLRSGELADVATVAAAFGALGVETQRTVLVVGSWDRGFGEEGRVAWTLSWLGHPDVRVLRGGVDLWPGPWAWLPSTPSPARMVPRENSDLRATEEELEGALLIDVREPDEFAGATPYGESWGGHLPGAINLPWRSLLSQTPGLPHDRPVVVYCTGGVRSGLAWLILAEAGYTVANYEASWWGWSSRHAPGATLPARRAAPAARP